MEGRLHWHFLPPYYHMISRLEKVTNQTRNCQNHCRTKDTNPTTTSTRSNLSRTRERIFTQRNLHRAIQKSQQIHERSRSPWRISKTHKHLWPSWVKEITSFMTMGSCDHSETGSTRHHRLQTVPTTTQRRHSPMQVAWRRRRQRLHKTLHIAHCIIILLPPESWRITKTSARL